MMLHNDHPFHISTLYPPILGKSSRHIPQCFSRNLELVGDPVPIFEEVKMFRLLDPFSSSPSRRGDHFIFFRSVGIILRNQPAHLPLQLCLWGDIALRCGDLLLRWGEIPLRWDTHFIFFRSVGIFLRNRPAHLPLQLCSWGDIPLRWGEIPLTWESHFIIRMVGLFPSRPINLHLMVSLHSAFPPSLPWSWLIIVDVLAIAPCHPWELLFIDKLVKQAKKWVNFVSIKLNLTWRCIWLLSFILVVFDPNWLLKIDKILFLFVLFPSPLCWAPGSTMINSATSTSVKFFLSICLKTMNSCPSRWAKHSSITFLKPTNTFQWLSTSRGITSQKERRSFMRQKERSSFTRQIWHFKTRKKLNKWEIPSHSLTRTTKSMTANKADPAYTLIIIMILSGDQRRLFIL